MNAGHLCAICGDPMATTICAACRAEARKAAEAAQLFALEKGRDAERQGLPVIYIHGRPYEDPGNFPDFADDDDDDPRENPFPWDLWDDWSDMETDQ